jgi:hypothetical protein
MKYLLTLLIFFSTSSFSQTITLKDFNFTVQDIKSQGLNKEILYNQMNRTLVRSRGSICSNRAHLWAFDFERKYHVSSPKIFLFYTKKNGHSGGTITGRDWWYHVSPMVNEGGDFFVMDAGFPLTIKSSLKMKDWLINFTGKDSKCKEIMPGEEDLVEFIYRAESFPQTTQYGKYDCYYKITPPGYWVPRQVAQHILGKDETGRPVRLDREQINKEEVYEACLEVSTTPFGWALGTGREKCNQYMSQGIFEN